MSNHTNRELFTKPRYIHRHVGGRIPPIDREEYINNQTNLIKDSVDNLPPEQRKIENSRYVTTGKGVYVKPHENRYDPYTGFLHEKGLLDDGTNRRRFRTTFINIDSRYRQKKPLIETDSALLLESNPLDFTPRSQTLFISHKNHPFEVGDQITMTGVVARQTTVRTFDDFRNPSIEIPGGCNIMRVKAVHNIPSTYDGTEIEVTFEGIKGDRGTVETSSFLGNIPTNVLNSNYPVRLSISPDEIDSLCTTENFPDDFLDFSPDHFYVVLPRIMQNPPTSSPYTLREYNFKVKFNSVGGVPLNLLNAEYPINSSRRQGFHVVRKITKNSYTVELPVEAVLNETGGGSCIYVSKVTEVYSGYPNPNNYTIDLGSTYHNIVSARLVSLEFPNTEKSVKSSTSGLANNKIYWNDIDDGDYLYSIEIPQGNYTTTELKTVLEGLFFQTQRVNSGADIGGTYTPNHFVQVNIDTATDIVSFRSFKEFILVEPIETVVPEISPDGLDANAPDTLYELTIFHPGHGMTVAGETILFSGLIAHLGIPESVLNTEHTVINIVDDDRYKIRLPRINLNETREETKGGVSGTIYIPDLFRLRFDQPDSAGKLLGFRNSGDESSITSFSRLITNKDPYEFDVDQNTIGENIVIENNSMQLSGYDYVVMVVKPFETFTSVGPVKSGFAKIILCDVPGNMLYNSHVNTDKHYEDPVHSVSELRVQFYSPDGELYDFNGVDHSFTLELVTVHDIPDGTGISANTGNNYNKLLK